MRVEILGQAFGQLAFERRSHRIRIVGTCRLKCERQRLHPASVDPAR
jgi:hypothetical protein